MAIEQVKLYRTSDGKTFDDERTAQTHQAGIAFQEEINEYLQDAGDRLNTRTHTRVRNIISDFLGWRESGEEAAEG